MSENETKLKNTNLKIYANTNLIFILFSLPAWLSLLLSKIEYLIKNFNKIEKKNIRYPSFKSLQEAKFGIANDS